MGTGPGLPGLPLAIVQPDKQFVLLDSLGKRIRFIRQVIAELGLKMSSPCRLSGKISMTSKVLTGIEPGVCFADRYAELVPSLTGPQGVFWR